MKQKKEFSQPNLLKRQNTCRQHFSFLSSRFFISKLAMQIVVDLDQTIVKALQVNKKNKPNTPHKNAKMNLMGKYFRESFKKSGF